MNETFQGFLLWIFPPYFLAVITKVLEIAQFSLEHLFLLFTVEWFNDSEDFVLVSLEKAEHLHPQEIFLLQVMCGKGYTVMKNDFFIFVVFQNIRPYLTNKVFTVSIIFFHPIWCNATSFQFHYEILSFFCVFCIVSLFFYKFSCIRI